MDVSNNAKTLFEIPIYLTTEEEFHKQWTKKICNDAVKLSRGDSCLDLLKSYAHSVAVGRRGHRKEMIWKFNQIVGYLVVCLADAENKYLGYSDIVIKLYYQLDNQKIPQLKTNIRFDHKMLYIEETFCKGFNISIYKTESELKEAMKEYVNSMVSDFVKPPRYVDTHMFEDTLACIDLGKYMNIRRKNESEIATTIPQRRLDYLISTILDISIPEAQANIAKGIVKLISHDEYTANRYNPIVTECNDMGLCVDDGSVFHIDGYGGIIVVNIEKSGRSRVIIYKNDDFETEV